MGIPRIFTTPPSATLENLIVVFLIQLTVGLGLPWVFNSLPKTQVLFALIGLALLFDQLEGP